ncbi:hypothetical protein MNBD_ALPHA12-2032 [hydrothermal vent metagenome]|uniref:SH3b domain-containing protein n=1 Tax=hydrothermal vent metagenome TaxID=652676 RepID=A0A3B0TDV3_9ZZZZ
MKLRPKALTVILIMLSIIVATPLAYSAPATATIAVNVRLGPGTDYPVVDTLAAGEQVNAGKCEADWCYIVKPGPDGWVFQKYLRLGGPQRPDLNFQNPPLMFPTPQPAQPLLPWLFQPTQPKQPAQPQAKPLPLPKIPAQLPQLPWPLQPGPASLPFNLDGGQANKAAPIPAPYQACFFAGENFSEQSKCVISGRSFSRLGPKWNDRISSLKVRPGARVTLCQRQNFQSPCASFNSNIAVLPPQLNNKVTSGRVF